MATRCVFTLCPICLSWTACSQDIQNDADWLEINLGPFANDAEYSDLKDLNITGVTWLLCYTGFQMHWSSNRVWPCLRKESWVVGGMKSCLWALLNPFSLQVALLETLAPDQKAELILDPTTGALENETLVKEVLTSILESPDEGQLDKFFVAFVEITIEVSSLTCSFSSPR